MNVLPDSQPLSPSVHENIIFDTEDDYEESQSLLPSSRKSLRNEAGPSSLIVNCNGFSTRSEILEVTENDTISYSAKGIKRKRLIDTISNNEEPQSLLIVPSKIPRKNEDIPSTVTIDFEDRNTKNGEANVKEQKAKSDPNSEDENNIPSETCIHCIFDKELDKRNYYFGNLLIGELQFLPPCMRSEAYVNILQYVDSLKQIHRRK